MNKVKPIEIGSKRVKVEDFNLYEKENSGWRKSDDIPERTKKIIDVYDKKNSIHLLVDEKSIEFLKGYINADGHLCGARIKHLPSGKTIARGGFSIFAKNLEINEDGKYEWDICYENDSGLKTYLYSEDKVHLEKERKAKIVDEFITEYKNIINQLEEDLKRTKRTRYLALYMLIKTKIRVGNIDYYHYYNHKGLTTLQKRDLDIIGNKVVFDFIGKDGVPQHFEFKFEEWIIDILKKRLSKIGINDFVFADSKGAPFHSNVFTKILYKYTKKHFYPHIIRSYFADTECMNFLKKHKKTTKEEVNKKFDKIAAALGHKKYNKKKDAWEICHKVTIDSYIRPSLSEEMINLYK